MATLSAHAWRTATAPHLVLINVCSALFVVRTICLASWYSSLRTSSLSTPHNVFATTSARTAYTQAVFALSPRPLTTDRPSLLALRSSLVIHRCTRLLSIATGLPSRLAHSSTLAFTIGRATLAHTRRSACSTAHFVVCGNSAPLTFPPSLSCASYYSSCAFFSTQIMSS